MHTGSHAAAAFVVIAAMSGAPRLIAGEPAPPPCQGAEHRAFDFWLGEWNVRTPDGKLAGHNSIKREYGGCVLHERYDTERGYSGESLNIYDAARKRWHQSWVDTDGTLLLLDGAFRSGSMVMQGDSIGADGKPTKQRITWTANADGSVRQLWEATDAAGKWAVLFDGKYTRR